MTNHNPADKQYRSRINRAGCNDPGEETVSLAGQPQAEADGPFPLTLFSVDRR